MISVRPAGSLPISRPKKNMAKANITRELIMSTNRYDACIRISPSTHRCANAIARMLHKIRLLCFLLPQGEPLLVGIVPPGYERLLPPLLTRSYLQSPVLHFPVFQ